MADLRAYPPEPLTVAAGQAGCAALDVDAKIASAVDLVTRASDAGSDVLVLPELFATGYELEAIRDDPARFALADGDNRLDPLAKVCAETRTRAVDNTNYVVIANHCGPSGPYEGSGHSAAWDPDGRPIEDTGTADPGLAVARLEPGTLRYARAGDLELLDPSLVVPATPRTTIELG